MVVHRFLHYPSFSRLPQGGKHGVSWDEVDGVGQSQPERAELQNGVHLSR